MGRWGDMVLDVKTVQKFAAVGWVVNNVVAQLEVAVGLVGGHEDVLQVVASHRGDREEHERDECVNNIQGGIGHKGKVALVCHVAGLQ